jgi:hypothetical protein
MERWKYERKRKIQERRKKKQNKSANVPMQKKGRIYRRRGTAVPWERKV